MMFFLILYQQHLQRIKHRAFRIIINIAYYSNEFTLCVLK